MIKFFVILFILITGISANLYFQSSSAQLSYRKSFSEITSMGSGTVIYIDQPVSAVPTSNGISLSLQF